MNQARRMLLLSVAVLTMHGLELTTCATAQDRAPLGKATNVVVSKASGIKLGAVPAGAFEMGSLLSEDGHTRKERQHTVRLSRPFWIGITEVTQSEYVAV